MTSLPSFCLLPMSIDHSSYRVISMTNLGHVFWENMLKNSSPQVFYESRYIIIIIIMFSSYIPCLLPRRSPVTTDSGANGGKSTSVLSTWITMDLAVIIYVCNMYIYIINIYIYVYIYVKYIYVYSYITYV